MSMFFIPSHSTISISSQMGHSIPTQPPRFFFCPQKIFSCHHLEVLYIRENTLKWFCPIIDGSRDNPVKTSNFQKIITFKRCIGFKRIKKPFFFVFACTIWKKIWDSSERFPKHVFCEKKGILFFFFKRPVRYSISIFFFK